MRTARRITLIQIHYGVYCFGLLVILKLVGRLSQVELITQLPSFHQHYLMLSVIRVQMFVRCLAILLKRLSYRYVTMLVLQSGNFEDYAKIKKGIFFLYLNREIRVPSLFTALRPDIHLSIYQQ